MLSVENQPSMIDCSSHIRLSNDKMGEVYEPV
jgi:hypothetical protein